MRQGIALLLATWLLFVLACAGIKGKIDDGSSNNSSTSSRDSSAKTTPGDPLSLEVAKLQGTWSPIEGEVEGRKANPNALKAYKWTFAGNRVTMATGGAATQGTFTVNVSANPKTMDIKTDPASMGKDSALIGLKPDYYAIYELSGDTLKVCVGNGQRPATFSSKGVDFGACWVMKQAK
jgi:uncharacterized protein (TIGR03067 family)